MPSLDSQDHQKTATQREIQTLCEMTIGDEAAGSIEISLFGKTVPTIRCYQRTSQEIN